METKSGLLEIGLEKSEDGCPVIVMNQGVARFEAFDGSREKLAAVLGITAKDIHATLPLTYGSTGRWTLVVPIENLKAMQQMRPLQAEFAALLRQFPEASIHPFCRDTIGSDASMHARHFSSASSGTLKDAVTGTASGTLGAYYNRFIADRIDPNRPLILKSWMGASHFLMKRLPNVKMEMSLHVLAYNLKRAVQIIGVMPLMKAMRA